MITNNKNITLRPYQSGDENQICSLFIKIFKTKQKKEKVVKTWHWKYKQSPYGFNSITVVNDNHEIIGHHGLIWKKIILNKQEIYNYQGGDTFIDEYYRGQGFILKLGKFYLPETNMSSWGFANDKATTIYLNGEINKFVSAIFKVNVFENKIRYWSIFKNKKAPTDIIIEKLNDQKQQINLLWQKKKGELNTSTVRDWPFIKWRIIDSPEKNELFFIKKLGNIIGYIAIKRKGRTCIVKDLLVINNEVNNELIKAIENKFLNIKINKIKILIHDKVFSQILIKNNYYIKKQENFTCLDENRKLKESNFYLTLADTDFYS